MSAEGWAWKLAGMFGQGTASKVSLSPHLGLRIELLPCHVRHHPLENQSRYCHVRGQHLPLSNEALVP